MVPLANAWRSGADEWDDDRRGDFANDLTRPAAARRFGVGQPGKG